jgi:hypothetical protein
VPPSSAIIERDQNMREEEEAGLRGPPGLNAEEGMREVEEEVRI